MSLRRVTVAVVAAVLGALCLGAPALAASGSVHGCPRGDVCIYPQGKGWNDDKPSVTFAAYGAHNLSNQVGKHYVLNNQYKDQGYWPPVALCRGYNGTGVCDVGFVPYGQDSRSGRSYGSVDLTPYNSVLLGTAGP